MALNEHWVDKLELQARASVDISKGDWGNHMHEISLLMMKLWLAHLSLL